MHLILPYSKNDLNLVSWSQAWGLKFFKAIINIVLSYILHLRITDHI